MQMAHPLSYFIICGISILELCFDGCSGGFVAGLFEQSKHIALVCLYTGLVEGVDAKHVS